MSRPPPPPNIRVPQQPPDPPPLLFSPIHSTTTPIGLSNTNNNANISPTSPLIQQLYAKQKRKNTFIALTCTKSLALIALFSIILIGFCLDSYYLRRKDPVGCKMSYMMPDYIRLSTFNDSVTKFGKKYTLYLYKDKGYSYSSDVEGVPVLFIPGNAGSHKQSRSLASEAAKFYWKYTTGQAEMPSKKPLQPFDFFTVDVNEELSALHGNSLLEQAEYINDAIQFILSLYKTSSSRTIAKYPRPTSVILVCHSMGGVVARAMVTLPNFAPGSVNTIFTLASPHLEPPAPFQWELSWIYERAHKYWRAAFHSSPAKPPSSVTDLELEELETNLSPELKQTFLNMAFVSIAGGNVDLMISSDYTEISYFVPPTHGFTVFTSQIPDVWSVSDHQCILWCNQLVRKLAEVMYSIMDSSAGGKTLDQPKRIQVLRRAFLSGLVEPSHTPLLTKVNPPDPGTVAKASEKTSAATPFIVLAGTESLATSILRPSTDSETQTKHKPSLVVLSDLPIGTHCTVSACFSSPSSSSSSTYCLDVSDYILKIPSRLYPEMDRYLNWLHVDFNAANVRSHLLGVFAREDYQDIVLEYVAVNRIGKWPLDSNFLIAQLDDLKPIVYKTTYLDVLFGGVTLDVPVRGPFQRVQLPKIRTSLLKYRMSVDFVKIPDVPKKVFDPVFHQSVATSSEEKFWDHYQLDELDLNFFGLESPFTSRLRELRPHSPGLGFRFWVDPTYYESIKITLQPDVYGSLDHMVRTYKTVILAFPFLVVLLVLREQLSRWNKSGLFLPFSHALSLFLKFSSLRLCIILFVIGWLQAEYHKVVSIYSRSNSSSTLPSTKSPNVYDFSDFLDGIILSNHDVWFTPILPFLLIVSIGVVATFHALLYLIVLGFVIVWEKIGQCGKAVSVNFSRGLHETTESKLKRKLVTMVILFFCVWVWVPYQFAFVVAFIVHVISCVRSLKALRKAVALSDLKKPIDAYLNLFNFHMTILLLLFWLLTFNAPVMLVWVKNLSVQWYSRADHDVFAVAPFLVYVLITSAEIMPRSFNRKINLLTNGFVYLAAIYTLFYGVRYTWILYYVTNYLLVWFSFVHIWGLYSRTHPESSSSFSNSSSSGFPSSMTGYSASSPAIDSADPRFLSPSFFDNPTDRNLVDQSFLDSISSVMGGGSQNGNGNGSRYHKLNGIGNGIGNGGSGNNNTTNNGENEGVLGMVRRLFDRKAKAS